jgi:hypothetical protein
MLMTDEQIRSELERGEMVLDPFEPQSLQPASYDIQELAETKGLTLGEMMTTLQALAKDVSELRGSVGRLSWLVPLIVGIGMTVVGIVVAIR